MASTSAWIDADVAAGKRGQATKVSSSQVQRFSATYEKAGSADGDGTVLAWVEIPSNAVLESLKLNSDALTGFSSVSVGLYRIANDGTFVDDALSTGSSAAALFRALTDMSAGYAIGSELDIMNAVALENLPKKIYELLGFTVATKSQEAYALCFKCTTAGTASGTLTVRGSYILS